MGTKWSALQVFGDEDAHQGVCCSCCEGYCPREDRTESRSVGMLYTVGEYLTDRFIAIHTDLVTLEDDQPKMTPVVAKPAAWTIPSEEPPTSTARFLPSRVAHLLALGIDVRQGETAQHLYMHGEHVGYLMPASRGRTLTEVAALQRLEERLSESESHAAELMRDLGMENIDALMVLLDVGDELRQAQNATGGEA
jgi:hypothetical protein